MKIDKVRARNPREVFAAFMAGRHTSETYEEWVARELREKIAPAQRKAWASHMGPRNPIASGNNGEALLTDTADKDKVDRVRSLIAAKDVTISEISTICDIPFGTVKSICNILVAENTVRRFNSIGKRLIFTHPSRYDGTILQMRRDMGISQADLASDIGYSKRSLQRAENGESQVEIITKAVSAVYSDWIKAGGRGK